MKDTDTNVGLHLVTLERTTGQTTYCTDCLEIARVDGTDAGRILTYEPGPVTGHCDGCDTDFGADDAPEVRACRTRDCDGVPDKGKTMCADCHSAMFEDAEDARADR